MATTIGEKLDLILEAVEAGNKERLEVYRQRFKIYPPLPKAYFTETEDNANEVFEWGVRYSVLDALQEFNKFPLRVRKRFDGSL